MTLFNKLTIYQSLQDSSNIFQLRHAILKEVAKVYLTSKQSNPNTLLPIIQDLKDACEEHSPQAIKILQEYISYEVQSNQH